MIESTSNSLTFTGGTSAVLDFNIRFFAQSDIQCYLASDDGSSATTLVRGTDFTVENKADYSEGAKITLVVGSTHFPTLESIAGKKITVQRVLPMTQLLNLPELGKLPSGSMETEYDKIVMLIQQLYEMISRCVKVVPGSTGQDVDLSLYAKLLSPTFTGTPKAPTPDDDSDDKQIATKEYVDEFAPLNSPAFTGTPTAPTALWGTSSTQIANCRFVAESSDFFWFDLFNDSYVDFIAHEYSYDTDHQEYYCDHYITGRLNLDGGFDGWSAVGTVRLTTNQAWKYWRNYGGEWNKIENASATLTGTSYIDATTVGQQAGWVEPYDAYRLSWSFVAPECISAIQRGLLYGFQPNYPNCPHPEFAGEGARLKIPYRMWRSLTNVDPGVSRPVLGEVRFFQNSSYSEA